MYVEHWIGDSVNFEVLIDTKIRLILNWVWDEVEVQVTLDADWDNIGRGGVSEDDFPVLLVLLLTFVLHLKQGWYHYIICALFLHSLFCWLKIKFSIYRIKIKSIHNMSLHLESLWDTGYRFRLLKFKCWICSRY